MGEVSKLMIFAIVCMQLCVRDKNNNLHIIQRGAVKYIVGLLRHHADSFNARLPDVRDYIDYT